MKVCSIFLLLLHHIFAQNSLDDTIRSVFSNSSSFWDNFEEVTPAPLKSIGALQKCGEGDQENLFACVPYYNCNPTTRTVQLQPNLDGSDRIDIRAGDDEERSCHFLEICCRLSNANNETSSVTQRPVVEDRTTPSSRPTIGTTPPSRATTGTTPRTPTNITQAFCGIRNSRGIDFTLNGKNREAEFGEFPWMVAILRNNPAPNQLLAVCGGSLIAPSIVLTGAHCVNDLQVNSIKVRAGEWDTQTENERIPYQEKNVIRIITHEHYMPKTLFNDVALLVLDSPFVKTESVGTICLAPQDQKFNSRDCFATGWGKETFGRAGKYSVILKKIQLPMVQNADCQKALRTTRLGTSFLLHRTFICAGGEQGVDTCTGDGGSPLVCPDPINPARYYQVGIVAWGIGCGEKQIPGVYVDVPQFRNWIDNKALELGINADPYTK